MRRSSPITRWLAAGLSQLRHPTVLAQAMNLGGGLLLVGLLTRTLEPIQYGHYVAFTVTWALLNALAGSQIGTRIARSAASGASVVQFQRWELAVIALGSVCGGAYALVITGSVQQSVASSLAAISFALVEVSIAWESGRRRFNGYLYVVSARAVVPMVTLAAVYFGAGAISVEAVCLCVALGNLVASAPAMRWWSLQLRKATSKGLEGVGGANLMLWVIASGDKLVLERLGKPSDLAAYAIAYGLLDRGFRSLSQALQAQRIGDAFSGTRLVITRRQLAVGILGGGVLLPISWVMVSALSGGRYSASLGVLVPLVLGVVLMFFAMGPYLTSIALGRSKTLALIAGSIAVLNIAGNLILVPSFGSLASAWLTFSSYAAWLVAVLWLSRGLPQPSVVRN